MCNKEPTITILSQHALYVQADPATARRSRYLSDAAASTTREWTVIKFPETSRQLQN